MPKKTRIPLRRRRLFQICSSRPELRSRGNRKNDWIRNRPNKNHGLYLDPILQKNRIRFLPSNMIKVPAPFYLLISIDNFRRIFKNNSRLFFTMINKKWKKKILVTHYDGILAPAQLIQILPKCPDPQLCLQVYGEGRLFY